MFQTDVVEKIKAHILHSVFLLAVCNITEKYWTAAKSTDDKYCTCVLHAG